MKELLKNPFILAALPFLVVPMVLIFARMLNEQGDSALSNFAGTSFGVVVILLMLAFSGTLAIVGIFRMIAKENK
ncbi:MAG: hypothetical protein V4664_01285 [Patescibacteria group bacterium]